MREFFYFSKEARTSGNFKDLKKAGRLDIACHVVIMSFFVSHLIRSNVKLHLFFYGPPDPIKHLEIGPITKESQDIISKKDVSGLLKRMLYKYKQGKKMQVFNDCWIEKKDIFTELKNLEQKGRTIYILDDKGEDIRKIKIEKNPIFVLGDHEGFNKKELKDLERLGKKVSVGDVTYFASQTIAIIQNELDRQKIE